MTPKEFIETHDENMRHWTAAEFDEYSDWVELTSKVPPTDDPATPPA